MPKHDRTAKRLIVGLAIAAGVIIVGVVVVGVGAYLSVRHLTAPLMYLSGGLKLERGIVDQSEFTPPAAGEITSSQLAGLLAVEEAVESRLKERIDVLRSKGEELVRLSGSGTANMPAAKILPMFGEAGPAYLDGKVAQVDAINKAGLSKDEYEWIRQQAYHAAGIDVWRFEFADVIAAVPDAQFEVRSLHQTTEAPAGNRALVAPHAQKLARWTGLAFFGL